MIGKKIRVGSIDFGRGFCKFLKFDKNVGLMTPAIFPSLVEQVELEMENDNVEYCSITHNQNSYRVPLHISFANQSYDEMMFSDKCIFSDLHAILIKAALKLMEVDSIELLVLTCPSQLLDLAKNHFKKTFSGKINLDNINTITVKDVIVIPTGFSAFLNLSRQIERKRQDIDLVLNCGFINFEWLVIKDMEIMSESGNSQNGIGKFQYGMLRQICADHQNAKLLNRIGMSLHENSFFKMDDKQIDVQKLVPGAQSILQDAVNDLMKKIGKIDIRRIFVIGGGANLYLPVIGELFEIKNIISPKNSLFSEIVGMEQYGLDILETPHKFNKKLEPEFFEMRVKVTKFIESELFDILSEISDRKKGSVLKQMAKQSLLNKNNYLRKKNA